VIEQAIAASMGEGTNAALGYGLKLPAALQGILLTAIGITALPYFANQLGQNQAAYCLHSLDKLTSWLLAGGMLLATPLVIFSSEIVTLLYQRGAFDAAAANQVAPIQLAYFLQLPFAIVAMLGVRALAALGCEARISAYTAVAVILQGALGYGLGVRYGAAGIAWAATLVSALIAIAYFLTARAALRRLFP
jgi:putative peptidoglycan lipid II flippase